MPRLLRRALTDAAERVAPNMNAQEVANTAACRWRFLARADGMRESSERAECRNAGWSAGQPEVLDIHPKRATSHHTCL